MLQLPRIMKAITLAQADENFILSKSEIAVPERTGSDLLIRLDYVGLNPVDAKLAKKGFPDWQYPHVLGLDAVGTVVDAPIGVIPNVGDQVMWHADLSRQGMLSEYTVVPNFALSKLPAEFCPEIAASLPCAGMTALFALDKLQLKEGENVFIDGGASAVGQFAIQFAKQRGVTVFASASKKNHCYLKRLGADELFDYHADNFMQKIQMALGHNKFDAIVDIIGGENTIRNIEQLRFCGKIACINGLAPLPKELLFRKSPVINIISLGGAWLTRSLCAQQKMSFMGNLLLESVASGAVKSPKIVPVAFEAEAITQALHTQLAGGVFGKQVVKIS